MYLLAAILCKKVLQNTVKNGKSAVNALQSTAKDGA